jgi:hypothetical protein
MRRFRRILLAFVAILIAGGALYGVAWLITARNVNHVFAATAAAQMCAGLFISGRTQDEVYAESFVKKPPRQRIYDSFTIDVDRERGRVSVSNRLIAPIIAAYAGDRGCVLFPDGVTEASFEQTPLQATPRKT